VELIAALPAAVTEATVTVAPVAARRVTLEMAVTGILVLDQPQVLLVQAVVAVVVVEIFIAARPVLVEASDY
jgi:hypothetical protein